MGRPEDLDEERRRIVRRLTLLTWGARLLALLLAVGGGAILAWMLSLTGMPFMRTWLNASLLLILVPVGVHLWPGPKPWRKDEDGE
jgi:hypothetical protein